MFLKNRITSRAAARARTSTRAGRPTRRTTRAWRGRAPAGRGRAADGLRRQGRRHDGAPEGGPARRTMGGRPALTTAPPLPAWCLLGPRPILCAPERRLRSGAQVGPRDAARGLTASAARVAVLAAGAQYSVSSENQLLLSRQILPRTPEV